MTAPYPKSRALPVFEERLTAVAHNNETGYAALLNRAA